MTGWKRLKRPRKGCTEIVIAPRGRKKTLYLVPCGKRAPWRHKSRIARGLAYCQEHKEFLDLISAYAKKSIIRFIPDRDYAQGM